MAKPLPLRTYLALYTGSERRAIQRLRRLEAAGTISPEEYQNRLARDLPPRPEGELLWCHVATDDAAEAASDMCRGLMEDRPDLSCLFTTSRQVTALKPPENSIVLPVPEENDAIARRFVAHFAPTVLCWIGGDFRPALLWHSRKTGVKCLAIDVTTRAPDFEASLSLPGLRTSTRQCFHRALVGSQSRAANWASASLEHGRVVITGFLERGSRSKPLDEARWAEISREIGTRPAWFASCVTSREIAQILKAHKLAVRRAHRLLLILSARDVQTAETLRKQAKTCPLRYAYYRDGEEIPEDAQVLVVPADEHDNLWHRAAPVSFLGGTLVNEGATDPMTAVAQGSAIIHGPNTAGHSDIYTKLGRAGATRVVRGPTDLSATVFDLLAPDATARAASAAWEITSAGAMVSERITAMIHDYLDGIGGD